MPPMPPLPPRSLVLALGPLALGVCAAARAQEAAAERQINTGELTGLVRFLSSDLLEGRAPGTRGDLLARAFIQSEFERCGLRPGLADKLWVQPVPMLGIKTAVARPLAAKGSGGSAQFTAPDDYTAVAGSDEATADWNDAALVFVGYGITAPEQQWDDFKGQDLRGKVLLVMNNDPADDPALFAGTTRLYYGRWSYKYEEAARRGAAGAIVIHTTPSAGYPWHVVQANHGRENFWLPFRDGAPALPIRAWCTEAAARRLCALGGADLDALRARAERRDFAPVGLGVAVSLGIANTRREIESGNVLARLPGSDPARADEVVVVTAHFDHLGRGAPRNGDDIYNGALDNASGTAGMLAIARACAALPQAPPRSLLFAAVTGEESGLLGSEWLANHLPCTRKQAIADFNIDGVDIWGATRDVEFIGYGKNSLTALAAAVAQEQGRRLTPDAQPDLGLFYRSDHFSFARIGVPAAYLKAGSDFVDRPEDRRRMKASYTATHYHQPSDELAPWWNLEGAVLDLQLLFRCIVRTASGPPPTWTKGDEFEPLR